MLNIHINFIFYDKNHGQVPDCCHIQCFMKITFTGTTNGGNTLVANSTGATTFTGAASTPSAMVLPDQLAELVQAELEVALIHVPDF